MEIGVWYKYAWYASVTKSEDADIVKIHNANRKRAAEFSAYSYVNQKKN